MESEVCNPIPDEEVERVVEELATEMRGEIEKEDIGSPWCIKISPFLFPAFMVGDFEASFMRKREVCRGALVMVRQACSFPMATMHFSSDNSPSKVMILWKCTELLLYIYVYFLFYPLY